MGFDFFEDKSEIDKVFDMFDIDGSGKLEYKELNKMLRARQRSSWVLSLYAGAASERSRRRRRQAQAARPDAAAQAIVARLVRTAGGRLGEEHRRAAQGHRRGQLGARHRHLPRVGRRRQPDDLEEGVSEGDQVARLRGEKTDVDAAFDQFDTDGGGEIELNELKKGLKRHIGLDPSPRAERRRARSSSPPRTSRRSRSSRRAACASRCRGHRHKAPVG